MKIECDIYGTLDVKGYEMYKNVVLGFSVVYNDSKQLV